MRFFIPILPKGIGRVHIESKASEARAAAEFLCFLRPLLQTFHDVLEGFDWNGFKEEGANQLPCDGIYLNVMLSPQGIHGVHLEGPQGTEATIESFFNIVKPMLDGLNEALESYRWDYEREVGSSLLQRIYEIADQPDSSESTEEDGEISEEE